MAQAAHARSNGQGQVFTEKTFYLEEFYGKSLLFALIPPAGERLGDLDSLVRTLRELRRNQTRCIVIASRAALPRLMRRLGRLSPERPPVFNPTAGMRSRPYPPDSAVAQIWEGLRAGSIVVASTKTDEADDLTVFAQELASRLSVFKLILLDRRGGLIDKDGRRRLSFLEVRKLAAAIRRARPALRRVELRAIKRAIEDGVGSVNLVTPRDVYEELFSFVGAGTLFTEQQYGSVRPVSIDDFEEVEALILRGQAEGYLLARSRDEIAELLPSCFGYRVGDEHLAGVCSLLTEKYRHDRAGEITALYTLTRFQGEGVAAELVSRVMEEARARRLRYIFACTSEERAAQFFARLKFRKVAPGDVAAAKWRGYDNGRIGRLAIFRADLT